MQNEGELRSGIIKRNTLADVPLKQYYFILSAGLRGITDADYR